MYILPYFNAQFSWSVYQICAAFITGLLNNIGTHIDPIILIQKIREGLEIPGLRNSLVQILHDYYLQVEYCCLLLLLLSSYFTSFCVHIIHVSLNVHFFDCWIIWLHVPDYIVILDINTIPARIVVNSLNGYVAKIL